MSKGTTEQALEAFIAEAKKAGLDIEKISIAAQTGIIGNSIYSWISTENKSEAIKALKEATAEIIKIKC